MSMEATFLTDEQIWGNNALQVIKSYGTKTGMSDLAIVLSGILMGNDKISDGQRTGYVWSASPGGGGGARIVRENGDRLYCRTYERAAVGARPALPSSVTSKIKLTSDASAEALAKGEARLTKKITGSDGKEIQIVEYGEYPQTIAPEDVKKELERALKARKLQATGKTYTFDGEKYNAYSKPFKAKEYAEYQHKGKRYICVKAQPRDEDSVLSNGKTPEKGEKCWIEVQPIEWLKDKSGMFVARQALFSGVQFDRNQNYDGNFENTDMKKYLDKYFSKEMQTGRNIATPAALGPSTAAVTARRDLQRQRALDDPSQGL
jgi:hypothetical protein